MLEMVRTLHQSMAERVQIVSAGQHANVFKNATHSVNYVRQGSSLLA